MEEAENVGLICKPVNFYHHKKLEKHNLLLEYHWESTVFIQLMVCIITSVNKHTALHLYTVSFIKNTQDEEVKNP